MTVKQIISDVRELCGEGDYASDELLLAAINTSLGAIYAELGITSRAHIVLIPVGIKKRVRVLTHEPAAEQAVDACGVAFGLVAYGKGQVKLSDAAGEKTFKFDGYGVEIYGHITGEGTLTFYGDYSYSVRDLTFFSDLDFGDIPSVGRYRKLRLDRFVDDFSSAASGAETESGFPIGYVTISGRTLTAPRDLSCEVYFTYRKKAPRITRDSLLDELPLPIAAISALTVLSAAYVIKSSGSGDESFFMDEYKRLTELVRRTVSTSSSGYLDLTGWA